MGGAGGFGAGAGGNGGNGDDKYVASGGGGGGGLGAGGDIFVQQGASLTIADNSLGQGAVAGGAGGPGGTNSADGVSGGNGSAFGDGIFMQGDEAITLGSGQTAGQTTLVSGVIADEAGSVSGAIGSGSLVIEGAGTVELDPDGGGSANTFTGGIDVQSGTLALASGGAAGSGAIAIGAEGGGVPTSTPTLVLDFPSGGPSTVANLITGTGGLVLNSGWAVLSNAANSYAGGTTINGGTLTLGAVDAAGSGAIDLASGAAATVQFAQGVDPANVIKGFDGTDALDLLGFGAATSVSFNSNSDVLSVGDGSTTDTFKFAAAPPAGDIFVAAPDGGGGTDVWLVSTGQPVTTEAQLNRLIRAIDANAVTSSPFKNATITLGANIALTSPLEAINLPTGDALTINGAGVFARRRRR